MSTAFEVGKTYYTRTVTDHTHVVSAVIVSRTPKFVVADLGGKTKRFGVTVYNGNETFRPWGRYSMAPIISSDKELGA